MKCCPTCGQTLPLPYPKGLRLSTMKLRLFEIVRKAGTNGISRERLMDLLYADDINGGPENGNTISVHVNQINKKLVSIGMKIQSPVGRTNSCYTVISLCK